MATWKSEIDIDGHPERVLHALCDVESCGRWSPIPVEVAGLEPGGLRPGSRVRLVGRLAGRDVGFDVDVIELDGRTLRLRAEGPFGLDVRYVADAAAGGTRLRAEVASDGGRGLKGRVLAGVTDALLGGGALDEAMRRIAREVEVGGLALAA